MRIALVNNFTEITGGADLHCRQLASALGEQGHEVQWVATRGPGDRSLPGRFVERKVEGSSRGHLSIIQKARVAQKGIWNHEAFSAMNDMLTGFRPDVVHVHKAYIQLSVAPVAAAFRRGFPVVQTLHDYEFISASTIDSTGRRWDHDESRLSYRLLDSATFLLRKGIHTQMVDRWIAVSRFVAERYRGVVGIEPIVLPNFTVPPISLPPGIGDRRGVVFIGRLTREKGVEILLEAARISPELNWKVFGTGPLEGEVRQASREIPNLEFGGKLENEAVSDQLRQAQVAVIPSVWEDPGPLACLEAMANGTPVVCFAKGGLAEYVSTAGGGVVCEGLGERDLVGAIRGMIQDPKKWRHLSDSGIRGIREWHDLDTYVDRLIDVYEDAIDSK